MSLMANNGMFLGKMEVDPLQVDLKFNNNLIDDSKNNYQVLRVGGRGFVDDRNGNPISAYENKQVGDVSNNLLEIPNFNRGAAALAVEFYVKIDALGDYLGTNYAWFCNQRESSISDGLRAWQFTYTLESGIRFQYWDGIGNFSSHVYPTKLTIGQWYKLKFRTDGIAGGRIQLLVDDIIVLSETMLYNINRNDINLRLCYTGWTSTPSLELLGAIDDFKLWNKFI